MDDKELDTITIDLNDLSLDSTTMSSFTYSAPSYSIGAIGSAGSFLTSNGSNGTSWSTISTGPSNPSSLQVTGKAEFDGDVTIKGVSITETLDKINQRLAILVPDPAKLEHFAALRKAYEHYKTLEALCEIPNKEHEE
jgi:hypothetical protein